MLRLTKRGRLLININNNIHVQGLNKSSLQYVSIRMKSSDVENPMNPNNYTEMAWESIAKLPSYASKYQTQYVDGPLILRSLLDDGPNGITQRILTKAGVRTTKCI